MDTPTLAIDPKATLSHALLEHDAQMRLILEKLPAGCLQEAQPLLWHVSHLALVLGFTTDIVRTQVGLK